MKRNKVRVCLIGAGRAGMIHGVNYRGSIPNAELVAIADPSLEACSAACKTLELERSYLDYRQALNCDDIDAVVVVSPTAYHSKIVCDAARSGKHVFCEKPMAIDTQECKNMICECKNSGVILQIGFMRRYDRNYLSAEEAIRNGQIGDVVMIRSNTRGPSTPQRWMYDLNLSNGPIAEVNSHDIDTLRWFSGSNFASLYAIAGNYRCPEAKEEFPDFYDNLCLVTTFQNGLQGMIDGAVSVQYGYDARTEILGTKGCVFIGKMEDQSISVVTSVNGVSRPVQKSWRYLFSEAYKAEDTDFIDCILEGRTPRVTGSDGLEAVKAVHAGNRSIRENRIVYLQEEE